jgi:large subunit ribosomal protein L17
MKKNIRGFKLSRSSKSRRALSRSLLRALVLSGSIKTTKTKAKYLQRNVEKMINSAKDPSLSKRRLINSRLGNDKATTEALFKIATMVFKDRFGGYTKITDMVQRRGDSAQISKIEWIENVTVHTKTDRNGAMESSRKKLVDKGGQKSVKQKTSKSKK